MSVSSYSPVVQSLGDAASYKKNITICEILVQVQSKPVYNGPLLYLLVSTRAVIGQFSGPYSPVRPAKI